MPQPLVKPYFTQTPSLKGRMWKLASVDAALAVRMAQAHNLPDLVAQLLASRGVGIDAVESFLNPRMKDHFPDPFSMLGMEAAVTDLAYAIMRGEKIGILADFDVDGATSSAILTRYLRAAGCKDVPLYIPDRLSEGYGPNAKAFEWLKGQGCTWALIADSGTTAFDPVQHATNIGLKTIILDHHEAEDQLPAMTHIINPKRRGDNAGLSMLAACGVSFLFCVALNAALREQGHFKDKQEPDLRQWLDLVALGTVCDMVPMTGANRLFVKYGFQKMASRDNPGIDALLTVGKIEDVPDPYHAGFVLGPRINAGSRVHQSDLGAKLLATDDAEEALRLAWLLDDCNTKRRAMQKDMVAHAAARVRAFGYENDPVIVLEDSDWHPGLVGLVAGDMKERFGKPACVIGFANAEDGTREGRGSGRSIAGINIADSFIAARAENILIKGGGHAMAGGFTVAPDRIKDFRDFMKRHVGAQSMSLPEHPETGIDGVMSVRGLTINLAKLIHGAVAPYGSGHPEPVFVLNDVMVLHADVVGTNHVRCTLRDRDGGPSIKAVAFRALETPLGQFLMKTAPNSATPVHLAGSVQINAWNGRESAEFHISDGVAGFIG
ncbi:MAG TPA: single-stranded-DNA-specific exonuclease RecJ [Alphaproteobacteria bacterium]